MTTPSRPRSTRRTWLRRAGRVVGAILVIGVGYVVVTPTGRYLARAAWAEGKILARRKPIERVVADPATPTSLRGKLSIVVAARAFAADSVRLNAGKSFTTFSRLDRDTLVLVLSAAYQDRLKSYTWWFPIVGRVPYKGYFDFDAARAAAARMAADSFDVYLRPAPAFSTLGWFNDPILPTTLRSDSLDLANTVVHELLHNTFYASGQAVFNESFANFVGARGAAWFFRSRGQPGEAMRVDERWEDEKRLAAFWSGLYRRVDSAFQAHPAPADKGARLAARSSIYASARATLVDTVGPTLTTIPRAALERARLDNAAVLARRIYLTDVDLFDEVWLREGRDLRNAIDRIIGLAKAKPKDPFGAVRSWLARGPTPTLTP